MRSVAEYREAEGLRLKNTSGYVAVVEHEFLGDVLWLRPVGSDVCESFQVVDWASPTMKRADGMTGGEWMTKHNVGIEVSHETAARWGAVGEMVYMVECGGAVVER
jgi:hypothetical protein